MNEAITTEGHEIEKVEGGLVIDDQQRSTENNTFVCPTDVGDLKGTCQSADHPDPQI